jgi:hypothetical protein
MTRLSQRPRFVLLTALFISFAACLGLWLWLRKTSPFMSGWLPNLGADFLGVLLVVFVVEKLLAAERERTRAPVRRIAEQRFVSAAFPLALAILRPRTWQPESGARLQRIPLDQLFAEWRNELRETFYVLRWTSGPEIYLTGLRRAAREWSSALDRFALAFEESDEVSFIGAIDEFVAWMSLNRDLFTEKIGFWRAAADAVENLGGERQQPDGSYRLEESDFIPGDVRETLTELFVIGADMIVRIFQSYESVFGGPAELPDDLWEEAEVWTPGQYRTFVTTRRARRVRP